MQFTEWKFIIPSSFILFIIMKYSSSLTFQTQKPSGLILIRLEIQSIDIEEKSTKLTTKANINARTRSPISFDISEPKWYKVLRKRFNLSNCWIGEFDRVGVGVRIDDKLFVVIVEVVFVVDVVINGTTIVVADDEVELSFESVGINDLKEKKKKHLVNMQQIVLFSLTIWCHVSMENERRTEITMYASVV